MKISYSNGLIFIFFTRGHLRGAWIFCLKHLRLWHYTDTFQRFGGRACEECALEYFPKAAAQRASLIPTPVSSLGQKNGLPEAQTIISGENTALPPSRQHHQNQSTSRG